jgi:DNA-binding PadR family transcriptional regulator
MTVRDERRPEARRPLSPAEFEVLIALADGEKHGYAVLKEIARRTGGGEAPFGTATLYAILRRFVADGVLVESDDRPAPALDDERRRYYRLTDHGRRVAAAEAARMEAALAVARSKKLVRKPRTA